MCGFVLERGRLWSITPAKEQMHSPRALLPQDKSFKSDRNALSQTTLKTCLLPK